MQQGDLSEGRPRVRSDRTARRKDTGTMAEVLLFHHAQGQTKGFHDLADRLRAAGHTVHAPDLYDGRTFDDLEEGVGHARELGFDALADRGVALAEELPPGLVYVGLSLGVVPAQRPRVQQPRRQRLLRAAA